MYADIVNDHSLKSTLTKGLNPEMKKFRPIKLKACWDPCRTNRTASFFGWSFESSGGHESWIRPLGLWFSSASRAWNKTFRIHDLFLIRMNESFQSVFFNPIYRTPRKKSLISESCMEPGGNTREDMISKCCCYFSQVVIADFFTKTWHSKIARCQLIGKMQK